MVILHIASINDNRYNGICVAVPEHVRAQSGYALVGLLNLMNADIPNIKNMFKYAQYSSVEELPQPFNRPDIAVFHDVYRIEFLHISSELRRMKIPYIIVPHGSLRFEAQRKKRLKKTVANFLLFNGFINSAVALQCLSRLEEDNTRFGRVKFIGTNGIVLPENKKTDFCRQGIRFVYIGRLEMHVKGLDLLVAAVRLERESLIRSGARFDIYGPDILGRAAELRGLIEENGVSDVIKLHSEIAGEEKEQALLSSDVFIQTSRHEGMPMGILEALAYGLPCLVTEGTTLGGYISETAAGWSCRTDADGIAFSLISAIGDKEKLKELSKNARKAVSRDFAWDKIAEDTVKKYKELAEK